MNTIKCQNPKCREGRIYYTSTTDLVNGVASETSNPCFICDGEDTIPESVLDKENKPTKENTMNIGQAIEEMKAGKIVRRKGWNGKGMHIYLEDMWSFPIRAGVYKGEKRNYGTCLVLFTAQGIHQPGWNASTPDLLASDWELAE